MQYVYTKESVYTLLPFFLLNTISIMSPGTAAKMTRQGNKHIDRLIKKAMDKLSHGESKC